ncbi:ABC transporter permease, partial [Sphingobacterium shayense]|nr:ABC transporter permease [Sphingobacterium shayense]
FWVQWIANVVPSTHFLRIFRLMFIQHADTYHTYKPLIAMTVIAMVCFLAASMVIAFKNKRAKSERSA